MSQTSYSVDQPVAKAGMLADLSFKDVVTRSNAAAVLVGKLVSLDGEGKCKAPAAATDITNATLAQGVVLSQHAMESSASGAPQYPAKSAVPVARKARVWVETEDAITVGTSSVNVRYAGTGDKGSFAGAPVTNETAVLPNARWVQGNSAAGLALLEIDL